MDYSGGVKGITRVGGGAKAAYHPRVRAALQRSQAEKRHTAGLRGDVAVFGVRAPAQRSSGKLAA
jgi:hypothetical protein